jgi:hypothetical protein
MRVEVVALLFIAGERAVVIIIDGPGRSARASCLVHEPSDAVGLTRPETARMAVRASFPPCMRVEMSLSVERRDNLIAARSAAFGKIMRAGQVECDALQQGLLLSFKIATSTMSPARECLRETCQPIISALLERIERDQEMTQSRSYPFEPHRRFICTLWSCTRRVALRFEKRSDPRPGPGEALVKVEACAVCRTDLHVVDGDLPHPKLPIIPGHEIVGRVEALDHASSPDDDGAAHCCAMSAISVRVSKMTASMRRAKAAGRGQRFAQAFAQFRQQLWKARRAELPSR